MKTLLFLALIGLAVAIPVPDDDFEIDDDDRVAVVPAFRSGVYYNSDDDDDDDFRHVVPFVTSYSAGSVVPRSYVYSADDDDDDDDDDVTYVANVQAPIVQTYSAPKVQAVQTYAAPKVQAVQTYSVPQVRSYSVAQPVVQSHSYTQPQVFRAAQTYAVPSVSVAQPVGFSFGFAQPSVQTYSASSPALPPTGSHAVAYSTPLSYSAPAVSYNAPSVYRTFYSPLAAQVYSHSYALPSYRSVQRIDFDDDRFDFDD